MTFDPIACGVFVLLAFTLAGVAQTVWFASSMSHAFALPLDFGLRVRGRRVLGANKTLRGFVVMVPAVAAAFALLGSTAPASLGVWDLPVQSFAALGAVAGFGFMAGELPNSFVKRQLDIAPGAATFRRLGTVVQFVVDRLDSGVGLLLGMSLMVPVPWQTWAVVLVAGPAIHWTFSLLMFRLGLKARAA
jgi:CDP-2,3-bis-(O-geranylgeranyl)-sn-glycerol synthase